MNFFLTYQDRMDIWEYANKKTSGTGVIDYFGMVIEFVLMHPEYLEEVIRGGGEFKSEPPRESETIKKPTYLRIVK